MDSQQKLHHPAERKHNEQHNPHRDRHAPKPCRGRMLSAQIWIKDIAKDFAGMNEIWDAWTAPNAAPTRATAQCEMGAPGVLVEIIVTAAISQ